MLAKSGRWTRTGPQVAVLTSLNRVWVAKKRARLDHSDDGGEYAGHRGGEGVVAAESFDVGGTSEDEHEAGHEGDPGVSSAAVSCDPAFDPRHDRSEPRLCGHHMGRRRVTAWHPAARGGMN